MYDFFFFIAVTKYMTKSLLMGGGIILTYIDS